jgi:hypothetical protein
MHSGGCVAADSVLEILGSVPEVSSLNSSAIAEIATQRGAVSKAMVTFNSHILTAMTYMIVSETTHPSTMTSLITLLL